MSEARRRVVRGVALALGLAWCAGAADLDLLRRDRSVDGGIDDVTAVPVANGGTGQTGVGTAGQGLVTNSAVDGYEFGTPVTGKLTADATCAVSASYCTIFSYTPATASTGVALTAYVLIDTDSTTVAARFRVRSADTGYTGNCHWTLLDNSSPDYDLVAIGTAPADTGDTSWGGTDPRWAEVRCSLLADASPGAIVVEWALETGTSPTQTVLSGSYFDAIVK